MLSFISLVTCLLLEARWITVKPLMLVCPLFHEFRKPNKTAKIKGRQYRYLIDNLDVDKLCLIHH